LRLLWLRRPGGPVGRGVAVGSGKGGYVVGLAEERLLEGFRFGGFDISGGRGPGGFLLDVELGRVLGCDQTVLTKSGKRNQVESFFVITLKTAEGRLIRGFIDEIAA